MGAPADVRCVEFAVVCCGGGTESANSAVDFFFFAVNFRG